MKPALDNQHHVVNDISVDSIVNFLDEAKAENITSINLFRKSAITDYIIIATGRSQRHLKSTAEKLRHYFHDIGYKNVKIEGLTYCDWVLIDAGDVIVHLFRPELREFYNLEKIWDPAFLPKAQ